MKFTSFRTSIRSLRLSSEFHVGSSRQKGQHWPCRSFCLCLPSSSPTGSCPVFHIGQTHCASGPLPIQWFLHPVPCVHDRFQEDTFPPVNREAFLTCYSLLQDSGYTLLRHPLNLYSFAYYHPADQEFNEDGVQSLTVG